MIYFIFERSDWLHRLIPQISALASDLHGRRKCKKIVRNNLCLASLLTLCSRQSLTPTVATDLLSSCDTCTSVCVVPVVVPHTLVSPGPSVVVNSFRTLH